ncbi:uncharacterized protein LOC117123271 [Anneissia japonica]|uniref:uncharacterized protein LOC117123271 n=1 Tax=Anneissia japonica TaxID=1529436 RepID=UPI001425754E|nr:uncharacterized protein LOC117123271 [Anneissia japonica]
MSRRFFRSCSSSDRSGISDEDGASMSVFYIPSVIPTQEDNWIASKIKKKECARYVEDQNEKCHCGRRMSEHFIEETQSIQSGNQALEEEKWIASRIKKKECTRYVEDQNGK